MTMYLLLFVFMYLSGLFVFVLNRKHLLLMLLSLEFIIVSIFFGLFIYLNLMDYEYFLSMVYITMSVCESALGLSILVLMVRSHGNDFILTFSSLW